MGMICRTCGDGGFAVALVLCNSCKIHAVHQYCLGKMPSTLEIKQWVCSECITKLPTRKVIRVERIKEIKPKKKIKGKKVHKKRGWCGARGLKKSVGTIVCKGSQLDSCVATNPIFPEKKSLHGRNGATSQLDSCVAINSPSHDKRPLHGKNGSPSQLDSCVVVNPPIHEKRPLHGENSSPSHLSSSVTIDSPSHVKKSLHDGNGSTSQLAHDKRPLHDRNGSDSQLDRSVAINHPHDKKALHCGNGSSNADGNHHRCTPMYVDNSSYSFERKFKDEMVIGLRANIMSSDVVNMHVSDASKRVDSRVTHPDGDDKVITAHSISSILKCSRKSRRRLILPEEDQYYDGVQATISICNISPETVDSTSSLHYNVTGSTLNIQPDLMCHMDKEVRVRPKRKLASTEEDQLARKKTFDEKKNTLMRNDNHVSMVLANDSAQVLGIHQNKEKNSTCRLSEKISTTPYLASFEASKDLQMTSILCTDKNLDMHAKPIISCIWRGCFSVYNKEYGPIAAHVSNKACEKVWDMAQVLPPILKMKMSRSNGWPRCFKKSPPTDENIALYFFVQNNWLDISVNQLDYVFRKDLMFKVELGEVELLVFSSLLLPTQNQRENPLMWTANRSSLDHKIQLQGQLR